MYGGCGATDFHAYYEAGRAVQAGGSPYTSTQGIVYLYPPLLAQVFVPLLWLGDRITVWFLWYGINLALLLLTVRLLHRRIAPRHTSTLWLLTLLFPMVEALYIGQVSILIMVLLILAWLAIVDRRPRLGGALLATAAWLKVFPVLLIAYFLWKRDWRVVSGALFGGVALLVFQWAVAGTDVMVDWLVVMLDLGQSGQPYLLFKNASILGFTTQWFGSNPTVQPLLTNPTLLLISRYGLMSAVLGAALRLTRESRAAVDDERLDLEYSLFLISAMLISPTLFTAGIPPLFLAIVLLWRSRQTTTHARMMTWFCCLISLALSLLWLLLLGYERTSPLNGLILSFSFYVVAALWLGNAYLLLEKRRNARRGYALAEQSPVL